MIILRSIFWITLLLVVGCGNYRDPDQSATLSTRPSTRAVFPAVVIPRAEPQQPLDKYVPGVGNFGFISADVWRGGQPSATGFLQLKGMGVKTIVDLTEGDESAIVPPGMLYVEIRTSPWKCSQVDTAAVLAAIEKSPKPVFIHCHEGRDRTGLAVAAYRLSRGMKLQDVIEELRAFHVNFWWRGRIEQRIRELEKERTAQLDAQRARK